MKYLSIIFTLSLLVGCEAYSVKENGGETKSLDECMQHCISRSVDGLHCREFSKEMAPVCKDYLHMDF